MDHRKTFFLLIYVLGSNHHEHLIKEFFTLRHQVVKVRFHCIMSVQGHLLQEVKNELAAQSQCRHLQEGRPSTMNPFCQWTFHSKDTRCRNFSLINSPHLQRFHVGRKDSKARLTFCSDFLSDSMLWITEVEMVDSVDELKSSRSIEAKYFLIFEMLDARIASSLNLILQNSYFKKKVSLEQKTPKEDWFRRGRQIAYMIYDYFRVTQIENT